MPDGYLCLLHVVMQRRLVVDRRVFYRRSIGSHSGAESISHHLVEKSPSLSLSFSLYLFSLPFFAQFGYMLLSRSAHNFPLFSLAWQRAWFSRDLGWSGGLVV